MAEKPRVFVAMPFKDSFRPVFETIKMAADIAGMDAVRVDEIQFAGSIISHINSELEQSDFVVAVVTEENGNVYYEIGLAHCQRKPVVLLTEDTDNLKFDLRDHRAIQYDGSEPHKIQELLVKLLSNLRNECMDPKDALASRLGQSLDGTMSYASAVERLKTSLCHEVDAQEPIEIVSQRKLENGDVAVEARDFFGSMKNRVGNIPYSIYYT